MVQQQPHKPQPGGSRGAKPKYRGRIFRSQKPRHDHPQAPHPHPDHGHHAPTSQTADFRLPTTDSRVQTFQSPTGDTLRIIVLGGCEEVGRNCTLIEYKNDIVIIDMGLQFPEENMPGIDYIIPNMNYLKGKEKNVRGVIITHGHYDHIGAIPHTIPNIGNPPIYALPMSAAIIKRRQEDFHTRQLNVKVTKASDVLRLGSLTVSFFHINHNIPDSVGIVIDSPVGRVCHTGDWKFDFHPAGTVHADFQHIASLGKEGVLVLMGDSTNANHPGHQVSEKVIGEELELIIEKAPGRVIVGTFASLLSRVKQIIEASERLGKKVAIDGYSMKTNVEIAKVMGYIKCNQSTLIKPEQMDSYEDSNVVLICTGAQGEKNAALNRIANNEHRSVQIRESDTIIFSSSVIPGNENSVQRLMDTLYRKGANVINYKMMDVHAGGHAKKEDIKLMLALFKPKYYVPIEGNHFLLRENAKVAASMGWDREHIFIVDNGQIMEFQKGNGVLRKEKVPSDYVFVDGLGVGDVSQVVLRDRQVLAEDGMVIVIVQIEKRTGKLLGNPDIISRGFIFMKDQQELIRLTREEVKKALVDNDPKSSADPKYTRDRIRDEVGKFLFKKTERRPMILPVVIEV
ncbi:ribonuclease J [Candidatus Uhrbacteria bacterium]|nr:ribonuclease J [Candidatus Uhrbacteria bacterium]